MKILLAWEMGGNYGHVAILSELARALAKKHKKKVELFFVLQTPSAILPFVEGLDYSLLQAPFYPPRSKGKMQPAQKPVFLTYADALRPCGYEDPQALAGLIRAWRDLFSLIKPDVLVTQAAPTALLAAKSMKIKTVNVGGSYDLPAKAVPMPLIKTWEKVDPKIIAKREEQVLGAINAALSLCDLKPVKSVADMLKANGEYVTMFEELDHYQDRAKIEGKPVKYLGKFYATENGQEISWNKKADKRVMAYIRPDNPGFVQCMSAFTKLSKHREIDIIVSAPGLPEHIRKASERANLRIVAGPVKLGPLLKDCDLGIDHASQGIACAFALNGIPQLLLPGYLEQLSFARALGRNKLGRGVVGRFGPEKINELMNVLLTDPQYTESARAFAKKYKGFKPDKLADQIAEDITLLAQKGS